MRLFGLGAGHDRASMLLILVILGACSPVWAGPEPILRLDPGGHTASVNQVLFTPGKEGRELVSVGNDKVIRFWDVATAQTSRTLRGHIGPGFQGEIYAVAMSPDGATLAVGGYPSGTAPGEAPISLYDVQTGRITRLLAGHTRNVLALAFAPDGQTLASASLDQSVRLWSLASGKCRRVLTGHRGAVYGIAFAPDGRSLASAGNDGRVRIWDVAAGARRQDLAHPGGAHCVAWSPGGDILASGGLDGTIRLWDAATGDLSKELTAQGNQIACLAISPDGTRLVSGLGGEPKAGDFAARVWSLPDGKTTATFTGHRSTVMSVVFAPDGRSIASAGEAAGEIFLWDAGTGGLKGQLVGAGTAVGSVGWSTDGTRVAWGTLQPQEGRQPETPLTNTFDLRTGWPGPAVIPGERWAQVSHEYEGRRLEPIYNPSGEKEGVAVKAGERVAVRIARNSRQAHDQVRCFTFTPQGAIVVGSLFTLALYDHSGKRQREFVGHTGQLLDVAVSPDGKYLASASLDQTIAIWPLTSRQKGRTVSPLLSLFMSNDHEWIAWTPDGYYACSPEGDRLIGWQVNRSVLQAAAYYTAYQFRRRFYRPDVIRRLWETGSVARALQLAGRAPRVPAWDEVTTRGLPVERSQTVRDLSKFAPPEVEILEPKPDVVVPPQGTEVTVRVRIRDPNRRDFTPEIRVANRAPRAHGTLSREGDVWSQVVTLLPGEWISARAVNDAGAEGFDVRGIALASGPAPPSARPNLYLLAIGVSQYAAEALRLRYGDKDAVDFVNVWRAQKGRLFEEVTVRVLTDKDASRAKICDCLDWVAQQPAEKDYVVVFFAGHGMVDEQNPEYYFAPQECDPDHLATTAVGWKVVRNYLKEIRAKVLLVLDTCHAGVAGDLIRRADSTNDVLRDSRAEVGLITYASCLPHELSLESTDWENGAFTKALIEELDGAQDYNKDGVITLSEVGVYLEGRMKELTSDRQHPSMSKSSRIRDALQLAKASPPDASKTAAPGDP